MGAAAAALTLVRIPAVKSTADLDVWLVPVVFLYAPIAALLARRRDFVTLGLGSVKWRPAARDMAGFALLILPVFLFSWWVLFRYGFDRSFALRAPEGAISLLLWQVLGVALPEEVFFRGWLQERLDRIFGKGINFPGAVIGPGIFISAAIFALAHFYITPHASRLLVFFPGLLFGYFRERSGSVVPGVFAHALGNFTFIIAQSWQI